MILKLYIKNKGKRNRLQCALMFIIEKRVFPTQNNYSKYPFGGGF